MLQLIKGPLKVNRLSDFYLSQLSSDFNTQAQSDRQHEIDDRNEHVHRLRQAQATELSVREPAVLDLFAKLRDAS